MEVGTRQGGSRRAMSQINVTPFVDVMLVLLIIFMVTAPMLETGVEVNLPEVEHSPGLPEAQEPLVVTVDKQGKITIGRTPIENLVKLTPVIRQMLENRKEKEVFLEADREVSYGTVAQVLAAIKKAGVERLGMVSQEPRP